MTTTKSGYIVRFLDGPHPLYINRGSALIGPADDFHLGDSLAVAALFATPERAGAVARATIAEWHWGRVEILAAERVTVVGEVVGRLGEEVTRP